MKEKHPVYARLLTATTVKDDITFYIEPLTIEKFFKQDEKKIIPDYQRPYSWNDKNITALLQDIKKVAEGKHESWFLGPLFTTKENPKSKTSSLLDGQQRITTIQLILREASVFSKTIEGLDLKKDSHTYRQLNSIIEKSRDCVREIGDDDDLSVYPKFETESTVKALFHDYIEKFEYVESLKDYKKKIEDFELRVVEESKKGSKTANNLSVARKIIRGFFEKEFDISPIDKGMDEFVSFIRALLTKCWIIEVPLAKDDVSTKIFESLNNRGKSLTLTDKLRYKCLINCESDETKDVVRNQWKKIYRGLEICQPRFLKNDEDFFKVFFNAINAKSVSDNDEIIEIFESKYIESNNKQLDSSGNEITTPPDARIKKFINQCLKVLDFYENILINNLNENNPFIGSFQRNEQNKAKALIQLVKSLSFSDNSRFLLFKVVLERHQIEKTSNYALLQDLWALVRITFFIESLDKKNSNAIRNNFLKIISDNEITAKKQGKPWSLHKYFIGKKDSDYNIRRNLLNDVLIANDSSESRFILYLYAYLNEFESISSYAADQYNEHHVEHLFPVVWQDHWDNKCFSKNEIDEFLKTIKHQDFPNLKTDDEETKTLKVVNEIQNKEQLELYTSKQAKQKDTLIQFIGNKWVIHSASNIKAKNYNLNDKKERFKPNHFVKIPSNTNNRTGLDIYSDFGYKEIITRSLTIINDIFENFYNNWDEI